MELIQWFFYGVIFTLMTQAITYLSFKVKMNWLLWTIFSGSNLLFLFGLAWAGTSFVEGVNQSGALALIIFCGPSVLAIVWIWRKYVQPQLVGPFI